MFEEIMKESYENLFMTNFNNNENNLTFENKKIEQNHIVTRNNDSFSLEDDEGGSFEETADESSGNDSSSDEFGGGDDSSNSDSEDPSDMNFDDDSGFDDSGDGEGDFDESESDSDNGDSGGLDALDNNKGSSLNPFTQINQKLYHIDRLNELLNSISHSIDLYNANYAEWSEVDQLKELKSIVAGEQKSFVMQQNPENLIKLGLYYEQYDKIVQNISMKISKLNSNNKN